MNLQSLAACALAVLTCSCAATSVKTTWKSPEYRGGPLTNIAVLTIDERNLLRKGFENRLARELKKTGVSVVLTHELLSLSEINQDKRAAAERFRAAGAQAIAILRLASLNSQYRESRPGGERYAETITGFETGYWYNYYSVAYTDMGVTYGNLKQQVNLETRLYDLTTAKGLWGGLTQTVVSETMDRVAEMDPIVEKIVAAMRKDGMVP
ncbi:MAG TPA: hypothetical protein VL361_18810 [Candidatus Limnocylindrales bacterium]|nr:hypothetical protein [Candidatus Limnocylindrales bacterium]